MLRSKVRRFLPVSLVLCLCAVAVAQGKPGRSKAEAAPPATPKVVDSLHAFSDSIQTLSRSVSHAVVQIDCSGFSIASDSERTDSRLFTEQRSSGSGVILSADGLIMTNAHVVQGARKIRVLLNGIDREVTSGGEKHGPLEARLVGLDHMTDLALLKIAQTNLPHLEFADSDDLKQGQIVLAFGSPLGLENSVSMGVVSAVARQLDPDNPMIYVQTDAPINPGNSGGPLVDVDGRVVGLNTFIFTQSGGNEGIGFAIPSNVIRNVFHQLRTDGHVHRGQIGVYVRTITPALSQALALAREQGVLLEDVIPGGPADKAGLQIGDIVLSIAGKSMNNVRQFALGLYRYRIGEAANIEVLRGKEKISFSVPVIEHPDDPQRFADMASPEQNLVPKLGILALTIDDQTRSLLPGARYSTGVIVAARTTSAGRASDGPQAGDIIYAVNGARVEDVPALKKALDAVKGGDPIVLQVEHSGLLGFVVLDNEP